MAIYEIFNFDIGDSTFRVRVEDGDVSYIIENEEGERDTVDSLNAFLSSAADLLGGNIHRNGLISEDGLEHYGSARNPSIRYNDGDGMDQVKIGGSGVKGSFIARFGEDEDGASSASTFRSFADDLLGKESFSRVDTHRVVLDGDARKISVTQRDDDLKLVRNEGEENESLRTVDEFIYTVSGKGVGGRLRIEGKDAITDYIAEEMGGVQTSFGTISEGYDSSLMRMIIGEDRDGNEIFSVDMGPRGVGGKAKYQFDDLETAEQFYSYMEEIF